MWAFDIANSKWIPLTQVSAPAPRYDMICSSSGNSMYISGGWVNGTRM